MIDQNKLKQLKEIVETNQSFALFGHKSIDGDAIGSMFGLGGILEKMGKDVKYFTQDEPVKTYKFIPNIEKISTDFDYGQYDIIFFLDFSDYGRIEGITKGHEDYFDAAKIVVMDHHHGSIPKNTLLEIKDVDIMSNCEWVFEHVRELWLEHIDKDIATYFYTGLTSDSGNFLFDNKDQSARLLNNALELVKLGADKQFIIGNLFRKKSRESVKFMQTVLSRMQKFKHKILVSHCTVEELEEHGLDSFESGYAMITMQSIEDVNLVLYMKYDIANAGMRISFRSKDLVDCSKMAGYFGGGGHVNASGAFVKVPDRNFEEAKMKVIAEVVKKLES